MLAKIFIIEDESILAKSIAKIMMAEGFEVAGIADDCQKPSEMINSCQPDLVICSLYLKFAFSGQDIIKLIRSVLS